MPNRISGLMADKRAATAVEYGLFAALISVVIISALALLGPAIEARMMDINTAISLPTP